MSNKLTTHWCIDCKYSVMDEWFRKQSFYCKLGHKPRLAHLKPKDGIVGFWSFKRKCADFATLDEELPF